MQVLRPSKRKDDVVLAITTTGTVKVWTLLGNENKYSDPIYENESKQVRVDGSKKRPYFGVSNYLFVCSLLDSMLERHQFELLFAKPTNRINCVRKILANL